jgi:predicted kinase
MGAPCSGKSTYVREQALGEDIIVDMDRIALSLAVEGTSEFEYSERIRNIARQARPAIVKGALLAAQGEHRLGVWIIHTDPSPQDRQMYRAMNAKFVELNPGKDVCLARAKERPEQNRKLSEKVIAEYYQKRTNNVAPSMVDTSTSASD